LIQSPVVGVTIMLLLTPAIKLSDIVPLNKSPMIERPASLFHNTWIPNVLLLNACQFIFTIPLILIDPVSVICTLNACQVDVLIFPALSIAFTTRV
jgi:hypothetical protein